ncbi:hypothetical protein [Muricoccus radiodurans]|uniref:hypothetical protein n=1 Tax=Muricoccus radiodurans TaxID=2231721 RepID=UPI003CF9EDC7
MRAATVLRPLPTGPDGRPRLGPDDFRRAAALSGATEIQISAVVLTEIGLA